MNTYNMGGKPAPKSYSHAIEVPSSARLLFLTGQIGAKLDGTVPDSLQEQSVQALRNIESVLGLAGMSLDHLIKLNVYLINGSDFSDYFSALAIVLGRCKPVTTVTYVAKLLSPEWKIEIEATAAAQ